MMDLLRGLGIRHFLVLTEEHPRGRELPPSRINKFPYGNQRLVGADHRSEKVGSCHIFSKFPHSNFGLQTAPETGWRVHPTPGAEGTALRRTPLRPMIGAINPVRHTPAEAPLATSEFQEEMR